jgi:hypothetical protein
VDGAVDVDAIEKLVAERKLTSEGMDPHTVSAIREQTQSRHLHPNMTSPLDMHRLHPAMRPRLPLRLIQSRHVPNVTAPTIQRLKLFWGLTDSDTPVRKLAARPVSPRSIG